MIYLSAFGGRGYLGDRRHSPGHGRQEVKRLRVASPAKLAKMSAPGKPWRAGAGPPVLASLLSKRGQRIQRFRSSDESAVPRRSPTVATLSRQSFLASPAAAGPPSVSWAERLGEDDQVPACSSHPSRPCNDLDRASISSTQEEHPASARDCGVHPARQLATHSLARRTRNWKSSTRTCSTGRS